jgi:putative iron-dependent peroxidase
MKANRKIRIRAGQADQGGFERWQGDTSHIERADAAKAPGARSVLTNIEKDGESLQIVRDNMPFGDVSKGEFGTYFIGYARSPDRTEQMLTNMFVGNPPGNYDRLLDFSKAVTGTLFFVPSATFLDNVQEKGARLNVAGPSPSPSGPEPPGAVARPIEGDPPARPSKM